MAKRKKKQPSVLGKYQSEYSYQRSRIKDLVESYANRGYIPKTSIGINSLEELIPSLVKERRKQGTKITAKEIKELKGITGRYIQKITEFIEPETGEVVSGFKGRTYERRQNAIKGQLPTEKAKLLKQAIKQTKVPTIKQVLEKELEREKQEYKERKRQEKELEERTNLDKNKMIADYIYAVETNNAALANRIKTEFLRIFGTFIDDEESVKININLDTGEVEKEPNKRFKESEEEIEKFIPEEPNENYRYGSQYADADLGGYLSFTDEIERRIRDSFNNVRGGLRSKSHHYRGYRPYDFESDKNALLDVWRNTVDRYSNTEADRRDLINHIKENNDRISELLIEIMYDSKEEIYEMHYIELFNILHYDAPTIDELIDFEPLDEL